MLVQNNKVIAYTSRQLKVHVKSYRIQDVKLGAVVFTLKICRHYLYRAMIEESQIYFLLARFEFETKEVVRVHQKI